MLEVYYFDVDVDILDVKIVLVCDIGVEYSVVYWGDQFVILINIDGVVDFKLMIVLIDVLGCDNWIDLVLYELGMLIFGMDVLKDYLICFECYEGLLCIVVCECESGVEEIIVFDEEVYVFGMLVGYEYDMMQMCISYFLLFMLSQVFDYDLVLKECVLCKEQEVLFGYNLEDYKVKCVLVLVCDGELVLVIIFYYKDILVDGSVLMLFYGYGFYGLIVLVCF